MEISYNKLEKEKQMKSKKIITILLSLAIMVTFMPAMAFAAPYQDSAFVWNDTYTSVYKVTSSGNVSYSIDKAFNEESDGLTHAWAVDNNNQKVEGSDVFYYDFTGAEIYLIGDMTNDFYTKLEKKKATLKLKDNTGKTNTTQLVTSSDAEPTQNVANLFLWKMTYDVDEDLDNDTDVNADINVVLDANGGTAGTNMPKILGAPVAKKTVKVYGTQGPVYNFYEIVKGKKKLESEIAQRYDGKEHSVMIDAREGYTLGITKYNSSTGNWDTVTAPITWKNAGEKGTYKATYVPATAQLIAFYSTTGYAFPSATLDIDVLESGATPDFGWTEGNSTREYNDGAPYKYELTAEQAANPRQFLVITNGMKSDVDVEELTAVFDEFYEIKVTENKADSNLVNWTITPKNTHSTFEAAVKASKKAHPQLWKNYAAGWESTTSGYEYYDGIEYFVGMLEPWTIKVAIAKAANDKTDDISFSGQTKFTYSGSKTTKKGALKAKKTITVKATADSGNAITYVATKTAGGKITVSKSGKITVKKGLKKGTYKVTVKAKTAAGNGYKAAKEKQTYTIVIKK
jgi:hypothetical protein